MARSKWKIIKWGSVPEGSPEIMFACPGCGRDGLLPVVGRAIAQTVDGVVFDPGEYAVPAEIECRGCRKRFGSVLSAA